MGAQPNHAPPRAVLFDAMGTLLSFEPPAPLLRAQLAERLGADVGDEPARAAIRAEIGYYRAHLDEGRDAASLAALRRRCAEAMRPCLPPPAATAPTELLLDALLAALRFVAYPDAAPALRRLRAAGIRLVVVSNWDVSLHEALARTGLAALVDGAISSAEAGAAKPDPAIFRCALALAGAPGDPVAPADALHAGDSPEHDVAGARAAGITPVLVARDGAPPPAGVRAVADLTALRDLLAPEMVDPTGPVPSLDGPAGA
jgi:putative hydrolase of the HAD superfamily